MTEPEARVGIYARVSTTVQDVQAQLARLRPIAAGLGPVTGEYVDDGVSGRLVSRPEFDRLRDDIRARRLSALVASRLDRLGRSARAILEFFDLAEEHGVRVVLADQSVDTSTSAGRVVRTVLAALAELEADLIRDRTQDAMDAFKAGTRAPKGKVGRPPRLTANLLAEIRRLRDSGLKWNAVALRLHVPASSARKWYANAKRGTPTPPTETPRVINQ